MRIHTLAMLAILTAAVSAGCGSANEVSPSPVHANAYGCDQCHGYPPPPFFPNEAAKTHPAGLQPQMCTVCHPATVLADGHTINSTLIDDPVTGPHIAHRDGQVEVVDYKTVACSSCHGLPPDTGRHAFHVVTRGIACGTCHTGYDPTTHTTPGTVDAPWSVHMNGQPDVILGNGHVVQVKLNADGSWADEMCADCHNNVPSN